MNAIGCIRSLDEKTRRAVSRAVRLLEESAVYRVEAMNNPSAIRDYLRIKLAGLEREEFHAIWLDAQNRVIAFEMLFAGTLTQTSVYPRELVRSAMRHNAAACVIAHNHPSGEPEPSRADIRLTDGIKSTLALVDVRLLDHFIVAGNNIPLSFAERGLI